MASIYVASSLSNTPEVLRLVRRLKDAGHSITYEWWEHGSVQAEGRQRIAEVAQAEMQGVARADCVVVLLPGGLGTHVELGIALAFARRVIVVAENREVLKGGRDYECAFYSHPYVTVLLQDELAGRFEWRALVSEMAWGP